MRGNLVDSNPRTWAGTYSKSRAPQLSNGSIDGSANLRIAGYAPRFVISRKRLGNGHR